MPLTGDAREEEHEGQRQDRACAGDQPHKGIPGSSLPVRQGVVQLPQARGEQVLPHRQIVPRRCPILDRRQDVQQDRVAVDDHAAQRVRAAVGCARLIHFPLHIHDARCRRSGVTHHNVVIGTSAGVLSAGSNGIA